MVGNDTRLRELWIRYHFLKEPDGLIVSISVKVRESLLHRHLLHHPHDLAAHRLVPVLIVHCEEDNLSQSISTIIDSMSAQRRMYENTPHRTAARKKGECRCHR